MKTLYDENWRYTEDALRLNSMAYKAIRPIMEEFIELGYNPREIAMTIMLSANDLSLEAIISKGIQNEMPIVRPES